MKTIIHKLLFTVITLTFSSGLLAQFKIDGQYIVRGEIRAGYGDAHSSGEDAASFVAHRARAGVSYTTSDLTMYLSAHDIRTWGDNATNKVSDDDFSVYQAWAEYKFNDKISLKVGRQELNYDNARFLGNLDWALQGRAHDFALFKYENGNRKLHIGGGLGEESQKVHDTPYGVNNYKNAQMLHYTNKLGAFDYSFLFWNEGRENIISDKVYYRQTIDLPTLRYSFGNTVVSGFYYHQFGKTQGGQNLSAYDANLQVTHQINLSGEGKKIKLGLGAELISGTNGDKSGNKSNTYALFYGTNHIFNGYMDLLPTGNEGLQDYYFKVRADFNPQFFTQIDAHVLSANAKVFDPATGDKIDKYLGTELDLSLGYLISNSFSVQAGYSHLFASDNFRDLRGGSAVREGQNWAYLMLIFRPTMNNKFIGVSL